jgi:hypothetical protein
MTQLYKQLYCNDNPFTFTNTIQRLSHQSNILLHLIYIITITTPSTVIISFNSAAKALYVTPYLRKISKASRTRTPCLN